MLGPRFDAELLRTITGRPAEEVVAALRSGVAAQLLVPDPTDLRCFEFRHALTRDALLAQLLPIERMALARQVLALLEQPIDPAAAAADRMLGLLGFQP